MSNLRPPSLGPIVGHTTNTTARLWIKAVDPDDYGANFARGRRTIGVIAVIRENGRIVRRKRAHYFRLQRECHRAGTFTLGEDIGLGENNPSAPLKPGTPYEVRIGTLTIDDPYPEDDSMPSGKLVERLPKPGMWWDELCNLPEEQSLATFTTFPQADRVNDLSFIVGSCRYPGLFWPQTRNSDAIFGPLLEEARGRNGRATANFVLMTGDQIYADMAQQFPLWRADTFGEFENRYIHAFGSRRMRKLLRSMPTYMILDDHEVKDNWREEKLPKGKHELYNLAIEAYRSYQWAHGPCCFGQRLYYHFNCAGYPFFVLDTRNDRLMDQVGKSLDDNHLLGQPNIDVDEPCQLEVLLRWLCLTQKASGDIPKFIVSSSVFVPNPIRAREGRKGSRRQLVNWKEQSDSWPAFPNTRRAILEAILQNNIQNVIFISGDIHCSNVAEISFSGSENAKKLRAVAITSSAFYWPWWFADGEPSNYIHDSKAQGQEDTFEIDGTHRMDYKAYNFTQEDNFCRVDVDPVRHLLIVQPFDTNGNPAFKSSWLGNFFDSGGKQKILSNVKLASW